MSALTSDGQRQRSCEDVICRSYEERHHPTQRASVPALQTDDSQEDHGDEDGGRHNQEKPGDAHVSSEGDRGGQRETVRGFSQYFQ